MTRRLITILSDMIEAVLASDNDKRYHAGHEKEVSSLRDAVLPGDAEDDLLQAVLPAEGIPQKTGRR